MIKSKQIEIGVAKIKKSMELQQYGPVGLD